MAVVAMGGLTGGGGRLLGPVVAQRLGADYVDRLILTNAARHVGATVEALYQREERPPTRGERFSALLQRILERSAVTGAGGDPYFGPGAMAFLTEEFEELPEPTITRGHELEDEKYITAMRSVMTDLAASGNVVIVGRGGSIILRDNPFVLRIGVVARLGDRVARIMERERLGREQANKVVFERDRARAHYFKRYFGIDDPDDPESYHLVINTSDMDMEYAAELVVQASEALEGGRLSQKVGVTA
jgi:cytidylate kinase